MLTLPLNLILKSLTAFELPPFWERSLGRKLQVLSENINAHSKNCHFKWGKKLWPFSQSGQQQMMVLQTAAPLSHFIPFIKILRHQSSST
jgi:hypothetical protein